jgi:imidazolonepropionase-like amidohydrolase
LILGGGEQALNPEVLSNIKISAARAMARDSVRTRMFNNELFWIKKFYDKGGKLVIGTDPTGAGRTIAGYANMWTLEILLKAGFTLPQAVMLCSLNGAKYLNKEQETGSIEKGKAADLILIDGDLTTDITLIRKIKWVFKDGTAFDSNALFDSVKGKVGLY